MIKSSNKTGGMKGGLEREGFEFSPFRAQKKQ